MEKVTPASALKHPTWKMGAKITAQGKSAVFEGVKSLTAAPVYATDLRAGAALIIAGIIANGTTEIYNLNHIDRGYESFEDKFIALGASRLGTSKIVKIVKQAKENEKA